MRGLTAGIFAASLLAGCASASRQHLPPFDETRPILLGYLPSWAEGSPEAVPFDRLTHVAHAFLRVTPEGDIDTGEGVPDSQLAKRAHASAVRVLLSIGGAESDETLAPIAADAERLGRFARRVAQLVDAAGYDGVDLDWEFPASPASAQGFVDMADALRRELDALGQKRRKAYALTAAVGGAWAYRQVPSETFRERFDFLNVMAYDHAGPWLGHAGHHAALGSPPEAANAPTPTIEATAHHWLVERGVPAERIVLGLPAYGRGFRVSKPYTLVGPEKGRHTTYPFHELAQKMDEGWTLERLDNGEAWLVAPGRAEVVGFDDPESVRRKVEWAKDRGLRGVFFWHVLGDELPDGSHPLIDAAAETLGEAALPSTP